MCFLDLFEAKKSSRKNKNHQEGVETDFELNSVTIQENNKAFQNLVTSFDSNDSMEYSFPKAVEDNVMNSHTIPKGTFHLMKTNVYKLIHFHVDFCIRFTPCQ